jgi:hypothetical protein
MAHWATEGSQAAVAPLPRFIQNDGIRRISVGITRISSRPTVDIDRIGARPTRLTAMRHVWFCSSRAQPAISDDLLVEGLNVLAPVLRNL